MASAYEFGGYSSSPNNILNSSIDLLYLYLLLLFFFFYFLLTSLLPYLLLPYLFPMTSQSSSLVCNSDSSIYSLGTVIPEGELFLSCPLSFLVHLLLLSFWSIINPSPSLLAPFLLSFRHAQILCFLGWVLVWERRMIGTVTEMGKGINTSGYTTLFLIWPPFAIVCSLILLFLPCKSITEVASLFCSCRDPDLTPQM